MRAASMGVRPRFVPTDMHVLVALGGGGFQPRENSSRFQGTGRRDLVGFYGNVRLASPVIGTARGIRFCLLRLPVKYRRCSLVCFPPCSEEQNELEFLSIEAAHGVSYRNDPR